jgi:hypothetical protein
MWFLRPGEKISIHFEFFFPSLFLLIISILLFLRNKWAWGIAIIIMVPIIYYCWFLLVLSPIIPFLIFVPFVLILLDRKNLFKTNTELTTQPINQKLPLPIKTKIVAWELTIIGGFIICLGLYFLFFNSAGDPGGELTVLGLIISLCLTGLLIFFLPGIFLFKKEKIGWYWAIISLLIVMVALTYYTYIRINDFYASYGMIGIIFFPYLYISRAIGDIPALFVVFILCILPFLLLLLDRKNFFKIAS